MSNQIDAVVDPQTEDVGKPQNVNAPISHQDDKDLYVRVDMKYDSQWDVDFDRPVEVSYMEVMCVINKSRVVVNLPQVKDMIGLNITFTKLLNDGPANYNELLLHEKKVIKDAIEGFGEA